MEKPKLVIPKKRYRGGTSVASARLPNEMIEDLDRVARDTGHNRNEVITICLQSSSQVKLPGAVVGKTWGTVFSNSLGMSQLS